MDHQTFGVVHVVGMWLILLIGLIAPAAFRFSGAPLFTTRGGAVRWLIGVVVVAFLWPLFALVAAVCAVFGAIAYGYSVLAAGAQDD